MLHYMEFEANGLFWLSIYAIFVMFMQIYTMTALREHYCIDMIGGIIMAHYFYIITERYVYLFDYHILGIPIEKRLGTIYQNS